MSHDPAARHAATASASVFDIGLYALVVIVWGLSWYPLSLQVGLVPEVVSVFYRILAAMIIMWVWVWWRGTMATTARLPLSLHWRFALLGACLFSANYSLFYYASNFAPSGLLAIIFSLLTVVNLINQRIWFKTAIQARQVVAALLGLSGVLIIFLPPVFAQATGSALAYAGLIGLTGTVVFSLGSIVSAKNSHDGVSLIAANTWGMTYGACLLWLFILITGQPLIFDPRAPYVMSMVFLVIFGTVIAFASFLRLVRSIGPGRAAYATVLFPIVALGVSNVMEGLVWNWSMAVGLALVVAGNALILGPGNK